MEIVFQYNPNKPAKHTVELTLPLHTRVSRE